MKQIVKGIFIALLVSFAFNAMAQEQREFNFYFKDFAIKPGETKQIQLYLKNNFKGRDFMLQVYFPKGLKPVAELLDPDDPEAGYFYFTPINRAKTCSFTDAYVESLGRLRLMSIQMKGLSKYTVGDAAIATLNVKADENYDGKQMIVFGNEVYSASNTNPYINKLTATLLTKMAQRVFSLYQLKKLVAPFILPKLSHGSMPTVWKAANMVLPTLWL